MHERSQRLNVTMKTFIAESKNLKMSPRKVRLVVDTVKKMPVNSAIAALTVTNKRASSPIKKALESAIANAVHNGNVNKNDLYILGMTVNEGIVYKRYHYAARGRIRPYKKRTSHLKVMIGVKEAKVALPSKTQKEEKVEMKEEKKGGSK